MTPERWQRARQVLNEALEREPHERERFVAGSCSGDESLRQEVEALVMAHEQAGSFLDVSVVKAGRPHADVRLAAGTKLGAYEVGALIGAGGMGEVYQATDSRLGRTVAIKLLPAAFAQDAERIARFEREARVLASLNHPNIAAIYGLEDSAGQRLLVMELVPGETLAERIKRGAIPVEEALRIAAQITEALEAAHEKGVVHRDLKPANIKVTPDGKVKVLDFGLAKAFVGGAAAEHISNSPTLSGTPGVIMGTAAYMSPEQARSKVVNQASDIWAFGCVLYEMLTGRQAFAGEDITDILAAVMRAEPDWSRLPEATPPTIRILLQRCLRKDRRQRLHDATSVRIEIEDVLSGAAPAQPAAVRPGGRERLARAATALFALIVIALAIGFVLRAPKGPQPLQAVRLSAEIGADATLYTDVGPAAIISPDGTWLAFVAADVDQKRRIYVRSLDQLQANALSGTENARDPFFSPNNEWIGFFADGKLKKISVRGGPATTLCDATSDAGGRWGDDDMIVFATNTSPLSQISSAGGTPQPLTSLDSQTSEVTQRSPQVLPGSQAVLFTSNRNVAYFDDAEIVAYSIASGKRKTVQRGGFHARYLPSGHLAYVHQGTLFAVPFDLQRLEVTGQPAPVLEGVANDSIVGGAQLSFSDTGKLVYVPTASGDPTVSIYWLDSEGKFTPLLETPGHYYSPVFSPDGKRLAMTIADGRQPDIWVYDLESDTLRRLTFAGDWSPVWTPDSKRITYASVAKGGVVSTFWIPAEGVGPPERLLESKSLSYGNSWRPDGRVLAFNHLNPATIWDVMTLTIEGDEKSGWKPGELKAFVNSPVTEGNPVFSPDGRWIAYHATAGSGVDELYVGPFPGPGRPSQISTGGGYNAKWSPNGKELFYSTGPIKDSQIMLVNYTTSGDSFNAGKPHLWSPAHFDARSHLGTFDLHPDGKRFAVLKAPATEQTAAVNKVNFIFNFFDELRRTVPLKK
jgi:serine/threonine-protein kinase